MSDHVTRDVNVYAESSGLVALQFGGKDGAKWTDAIGGDHDRDNMVAACKKTLLDKDVFPQNEIFQRMTMRSPTYHELPWRSNLRKMRVSDTRGVSDGVSVAQETRAALQGVTCAYEHFPPESKSRHHDAGTFPQYSRHILLIVSRSNEMFPHIKKAGATTRAHSQHILEIFSRSSLNCLPYLRIFENILEIFSRYFLNCLPYPFRIE